MDQYDEVGATVDARLLLMRTFLAKGTDNSLSLLGLSLSTARYRVVIETQTQIPRLSAAHFSKGGGRQAGDLATTVQEKRCG